MRWLLIVTSLTFALICFGDSQAKEPTLNLPPPGEKITMPNAIYGHEIHRLDIEFQKNPSLNLAKTIVNAMERLLCDWPDGRFAETEYIAGMRVGKLRIYFWDNYGGPLGFLAGMYKFLGRDYEALTLLVREALVVMEDLGVMEAFGVQGFPNIFRADPPLPLKRSIEFSVYLNKKGKRIPPLIFFRSWALRAQWKGEDIKDALVSFNDLAYCLLGELRWWDLVQRDFKKWRFTLPYKGRSFTFTADSQKAIVSGKEIPLSRKVERFYYDLYVPISDVVKILGGCVRAPMSDELVMLQKHLPVRLLVVDLD